MKTNLETKKARPKTATRQGIAAARAIEALQAFNADPTADSQDMRRVAFDLLSAYQLHRVEVYARDAPTDEEALSDFIHEAADSMAIYTADNLATLIGSENWQAASDEGDQPEPNYAALAYFANRADLERFLSIERGA